jgi:hypothetical protein
MLLVAQAARGGVEGRGEAARKCSYRFIFKPSKTLNRVFRTAKSIKTYFNFRYSYTLNFLLFGLLFFFCWLFPAGAHENVRMISGE